MGFYTDNTDIMVEGKLESIFVSKLKLAGERKKS